METISVIVTEIIICLVLAWSLGFLVAWILFNKASKVYREEIEVLEENLNYSAACNKNQENDIIRQSLKIKEFEKSLKGNQSKRQMENKRKSNSEKIKKEKRQTSDTPPFESKRTKKETAMLKSIEENLV
jgi:hypothetical protein